MTADAATTASAEERSLGVHESQLLLPKSARLQWSIKVGVVIAVSAVLAVALPYALAAPFQLAVDPRTSRALPIAAIGVVMTAVSYVSSLTDSGLRALTTSAVALAGAAVATALVTQLISLAIRTVLMPLLDGFGISISFDALRGIG